MSDAPDWTIPTSIRAQEIDTVKVDIAAQSVDKLDVNLASQTATLNVSGDVNVTNDQLNVNVTNTQLDVNVANTPVDINIAGQDADVNVNVTNSTINVSGSVDANITNTQLDVNVTNSTLTVTTSGTTDVNIVAQSVDLNVKNQSYLECRKVLANNADTYTNISHYAYRAKFFTNNCNGFVEKVSVYVKNTDTENTRFIQVALAVYPGGPPLYSVDVGVNAGYEGWVNAEFNVFWQYQTLFVIVHPYTSYVQTAYDDGDPKDQWYSDDGGVTWHPDPFRLWVKVYLRGARDALPVQGMVGSIVVPCVSATSSAGNQAVYPNSDKNLANFYGTGWLRFMVIRVEGIGAADAWLTVDVDGEHFIYTRFDWLYNLLGSTTGEHGDKIYFRTYDTTNKVFIIRFNNIIQFRRHLLVKFRNEHDTDVATVSWFIAFDKLA